VPILRESTEGRLDEDDRCGGSVRTGRGAALPGDLLRGWPVPPAAGAAVHHQRHHRDRPAQGDPHGCGHRRARHAGGEGAAVRLHEAATNDRNDALSTAIAGPRKCRTGRRHLTRGRRRIRPRSRRYPDRWTRYPRCFGYPLVDQDVGQVDAHRRCTGAAAQGVQATDGDDSGRLPRSNVLRFVIR